MKVLTHLDLFSGIGGFSLAAKWSGFKTVAFCEKDEFCRKVLFKHWPDTIIYDDVKTLNFTAHVDLITGGFPCQPFSVAGSKKGKDDDRYLWPEFLRIIKECNPNWVVAENVPGIVDMELDNILDDLEAEGYETLPLIIPACAASAPHKRERLWIIANRNGERYNMRPDIREERYLQNNIDRYVKKIQSEWAQLIPKSWEAFNAQNWIESFSNASSIACSEGTENIKPCSERQKWALNTSEVGVTYSRDEGEENKPPLPGVDDGLPHIMDRNRALGNAIVPQVIYPILAAIHEIETNYGR